jgi:hypothetical protein
MSDTTKLLLLEAAEFFAYYRCLNEPTQEELTARCDEMIDRMLSAATPSPEAAPQVQPVAWLWQYVGKDPYPRTVGNGMCARMVHEMDPHNPPYPETWKPVGPLHAAPPQPLDVQERQDRAVATPIAPQWLPIESAPKDGSQVIAWWEAEGFDAVGVLMTSWLDNSKTRVPWAGWRVPSMTPLPPRAKPTHWMPLPDPPHATPSARDCDSTDSSRATSSEAKQLREALDVAYDVLKLARSSHGNMLLSDPPQEAWKGYRVDEHIARALAAIDSALSGTEENDHD